MSTHSVLIFSQNYAPSSLADSIRIQPIVSYFLKKNYLVNVITQTGRYEHGVDTKGFNISRLFSFKPINKDGAVIRLIKEIILGCELFTRILFYKRFDLYIFTSPPFITCTIGVLAVFLKNGKLIFDVRDLYPEIYVKQKLIRPGGYFHKILVRCEKFIYAKSFKVLAATEGLKNSISRITTTECLLLTNGYSDFFFPSDLKYRNFTIVFHGNLGKFQNIELLVELVESLSLIEPEINFIVIGSGPKESLLTSLKFTNFKFLGRLSNLKTAEIVRQCHLGLSLRDDSKISIDSFPVKLFEYIGAGIPSIVTPISEGGDILANHDFGFNVENKLELIRTRILDIYRNKDLHQSLITNILNNREQFSRAKIVDNVLDLML